MSTRRPPGVLPQSDGRWFVRVGLALLLLSLLPLAAAAIATPAGMRFGGFVYEARDAVSYAAKATEGLAGQWLYHDPYTSESQPPTLIYMPYILLGELDRLLHLPVAVVLHVARMGLAAALLFAAWRLCEAAFPEGAKRRLAFLLVMLGGGIGALTGSHLDLAGYHYVSLDAGVSGSIGLEVLSLPPHLVLACLGAAWVGLTWVRQEQAPTLRRTLVAAVWTLLVSAVYPQLAACLALVLVACWLLTRRTSLLPTVVAVSAAAAPYAAYGLYLRASSPVFAAWPPQSDIDLGDPLSFLVFGHLVMLPFAGYAAVRAWRGRRAGAPLGVVGMSAAWVVVATVLMYLPGLPTVAHRVFYASFIPFGVLAAEGLWTWARERPRPSRRRLVYPAMLMCLAGGWAVASGFAIPLLHRNDLALYFPDDEARVLEVLAERQPGGGSLVLSSYLSGLYVPALSRQDTFIGFPGETLDLNGKNATVRRVYGAPDGAEADRRARATGARYVLWGRYEMGLGGIDPGPLAGWREVARAGDARLYEVGPDSRTR